MARPALNHLLRTMAAVAPGQRVLLRGAEDGRLARALSRMGFEVHAALGHDAAARRVQETVEAADGAAASRSERAGQSAPVYATAAPVGALPYPEAHFAWVVVRGPEPGGASSGDLSELLAALLEEARRHVQPGGWVFLLVPAGEEGPAGAVYAPEALDEAAKEAALAQAETPEQSGAHVHAIYRRVGEGTQP